MHLHTTAILLAGPEGDPRSAARAWLAAAGYEVEVAQSAEDALRRAAVRAYDGVLVDADLGPSDSIALVERLRALSDDLTILVQRDAEGTLAAAAALRAGADDLIPRPAEEGDLELLGLALGRSIESHAALRARRAEASSGGAASGVRTTQAMSQPLTVILGTVDLLLLDLSLDSRVRSDLLTVQREAQRLGRLAATLGAPGSEAESHKGVAIPA